MSQAYALSDSDQRTFGELIQRVVDETKRPDLLGEIPGYIRDAIRYYSRQPFFFNQVDNTAVTTWAASLYIPRGYTIRDTASDGNYYIFVALTPGNNDSSKPTFTPTLFTPSGTAGIVFVAGQDGTTVDNEVTWATVEAWPATNADVSTRWAQLSTVPAVNQYVGPIDYVAPRVIEITAAGNRYELNKIGYPKLRSYDVVRPAPMTTYPTEWAWFQKQIYVWPYSNGFYPLTLSYYSAPFPPMDNSDSNFWTTTAEAMIRNYAKARIQAERIRDPDAALTDMKVAQDEFKSLKLQEVIQESTGAIPPSNEWGGW